MNGVNRSPTVSDVWKNKIVWTVAAGLVVLLLTTLFLAQRYDVKYVYDYSSNDLETAFRVAAVWAGQPGSFVIWAFWGLIAAQFLIRRTRHAEQSIAVDDNPLGVLVEPRDAAVGHA